MSAKRAARRAARWLGWVLVGVVVCLPFAAERAVEHVSLDDRVGTLPVEVSLAHNGASTLDTGVLGRLYWDRTGAFGFGANLRSTGPPVAGGTLASYVSPAFVKANVASLDDPGVLARAYGEELRDRLVTATAWYSLAGGVVLGTLLLAASTAVSGRARRTRWTAGVLTVVLAGCASTGTAVAAFRSWEGEQTIGVTYPLPKHPELAFSSPQTREIAEQIQPFIEKNTARIRERSEAYEDAVALTAGPEIARQADELAPRDGEVVVIAEADPQGSLVGTDVRRALYPLLEDGLDPDDEGRVVLRTIAGDISSNGTVAEKDFVAGEAAASPGVPVVAAKGDHDTDTTVQQLLDADATVPDTEVVDAGGLRVASARDPAFKALFGGLVVNDTGVTEEDIGAALRTVVDDSESDGAPEALQVVLHQPRAVAGYLGVDLDDVKDAGSPLTTPVDDGIPDLPPGSIDYGHLHDPAGPWVVWNTDGDEVTWTVISQLGTAGGVEENPTFNRFSTPFSVPLKAISIHLEYVDAVSGLQTGYLPISIATDGRVSVGDRVDVGLPGGQPGEPGQPQQDVTATGGAARGSPR